MPYVFCLGYEETKFNAFKKGFEDDLKAIKLDWNTVYVQNLCRNYFSVESSKNNIWVKAVMLKKVNKKKEKYLYTFSSENIFCL